MANDVDTLVSSCAKCARSCKTLRNRRNLHTFLVPGPLEFMAIEILNTLPRNVILILMTDRYSKMKIEIVTSRTTVTHVSNALLNHYILPYGIPEYLLTDKGSHFVSTFIAILCRFIGLKHLPTAAHRPQTNSQIERYKERIVLRIRNYVGERREKCYIFV